MTVYAADWLPREVALRLNRAMTAAEFRRRIVEHSDRDELWSRYRHGAEWFGQDWQTRVDQVAVRGALADAERAVPFPASGP